MKKVVWLSRHEMTAEQVDGLKKSIGDDVTVETVNMVWLATDDFAADEAANRDNMRALFEKYDILAGVFPPVAIEALNAVRAELCDLGEEERRIEFRHARWAVI